LDDDDFVDAEEQRAEEGDEDDDISLNGKDDADASEFVDQAEQEASGNTLPVWETEQQKSQETKMKEVE